MQLGNFTTNISSHLTRTCTHIHMHSAGQEVTGHALTTHKGAERREKRGRGGNQRVSVLPHTSQASKHDGGKKRKRKYLSAFTSHSLALLFTGHHHSSPEMKSIRGQKKEIEKVSVALPLSFPIFLASTHLSVTAEEQTDLFWQIFFFF